MEIRMEPKLFFWIDSHFVHYFLAKSIKEKINCKIYSCFEITDKPKKYFEKQNLVDFEEFWIPMFKNQGPWTGGAAFVTSMLAFAKWNAEVGTGI